VVDVPRVLFGRMSQSTVRAEIMAAEIGVVADVLGLNHRDVAVIDVQPEILTVDILRSTVI